MRDPKTQNDMSIHETEIQKRSMYNDASLQDVLVQNQSINHQQ